jgi:hypothetical protein
MLDLLPLYDIILFAACVPPAGESVELTEKNEPRKEQKKGKMGWLGTFRSAPFG